MEDVVQSAPSGATTPESGAMQGLGGQPPQPEPAGQMPEGVQAPEGDQQPELTPQEEYFLQASTGTVYKSREAAIAGIEAKDQYIQQLKETVSQLSQSRAPQPPPVDPQAATSDAIAQLQSEFEQELRSDPRFQGASPEAIADEAYIQAKAAYRIEQRMMKQYEQRQQQTQWQQFVRETPDLNTPLAQEVYDRAMQSGYKFPTPQAHLDAVHAEMWRRGIQPNQSQAGGNMGVQGAIQNQPRPIFGQPQGTGAAPQSAPMSETVRKQVEFAQRMGKTGEQLERIKQLAIQNEARFRK